MQALLQARREIAKALVEPVLISVARHDTAHTAFHGSIDWHSAVHGTWALTAYARMTGDTICDALLEETLRPDKLAAERALLAARPDFEMPYGRAWLLRLAREHALLTSDKDGALQLMAAEVLASMLAHYRRRAPDPRRGSYGSDSWALINMLDYAVCVGDGTAQAFLRGLVETHFIANCRGSDYALEDGHFMAVATNWAWLLSKVLPPEEFQHWERDFFASAGLPQPVVNPKNWHHHGLNFSRAWGLWALGAVSTPGDRKDAYLKAFATHFHATYDTPALWRGSYQGVGHWVPQFGLLALQPLLGS